MKVLAEQNTRQDVRVGIAQVFMVLVLVMPSLFAFLVSLTFDSAGSTVPGLWLFYKIALNVGYGAVPVAVGLTALAIYGRESSMRSVAAMAVLSAAGIALTWYASQL